MIAQDDFPMFATAQPVEQASAGCPFERINAMPYKEMLWMVRNSPLNDPLFRGKVGIHFHAVMKEKRHALPADERAAISTQVGY